MKTEKKNENLEDSLFDLLNIVEEKDEKKKQEIIRDMRFNF